MNVPGYKYLGLKGEVDNGDPVNELDSFAREHDINYGRLGAGAYFFGNEADEIFVNRKLSSGSGKRLKLLADTLFNYKSTFLPQLSRKIPKKGEKRIMSNLGTKRVQMNPLRESKEMDAAANLIARAAQRFTRKRVSFRKSGRRMRSRSARSLKLKRRRFSRKGRLVRKRSVASRRKFSRSRSRFRAKRRRNGSFAKKVLSILQPMYYYRNTYLLREAGTVNRGTLWDPTTYYITGTPTATRLAFGSAEWYNYVITTSSASTYVPSANDFAEFWILKEKLSMQISNNSNVPQLLKVYYYKAVMSFEDDDGTVSPLKLFGQNDSTTWFSNNATEDIMVEEKVFAGTLTLTGVKYNTIPSFSPMKNRELKRVVNKYYTVRKIKTFMMNPSETRSLSIGNFKPYLYSYKNTIGDSMESGTNMILKNRTKGMFLKWQGDILPSQATAGKQAMNPGNIGVKILTDVKWCLKTVSNNVYYNNRYTQGFATDPAVYGSENNAAVVAV